MADLTKEQLLKALKSLTEKDLEKIGLRSMSDKPLSEMTGEEKKKGDD